MLGACREPDPAANPGVSLGIAMGTLAAGRPGQADVPRRRRDRLVRGVGRAAHRREHRQARRRHRAGRPRAAGRAGRVRPGPRLRPAVRAPMARTAAATRSRRNSEPPATRSSASSSPTPSTSAREFVRWEVATAIAGAVLEHRPVRPAERRGGQAADPRRARQGRSRRADPRPARRAADATDAGRRRCALAAHLGRRAPNAYLALQAFIAPTTARDEAFARIRTLLRDRTRNATTAGYGPRFLHSTGQLHKGGAPIGWFLQLTADHPRRPRHPGLAVHLRPAHRRPGRRRLRGASTSHDLPILRIHLGADPDAGLAALERALDAALRTTPEG